MTYQRTKSQYSPEQLEALKIMWLTMKEDKIRDRRCKGKLNWIERDFPLTSEEQKEMAAFERMMLVEMSFGNNLENSDI